MKVKIKGLVFVGFAAAILSANAMAADNTVTSKSYVDTNFQTKANITTTIDATNPSDTKYPSESAITAYVTTAGGQFQTKSQAADVNKVANGTGGWKALNDNIATTTDTGNGATTAAIKTYVADQLAAQNQLDDREYQPQTTDNLQLGGANGTWADLGTGFANGTYTTKSVDTTTGIVTIDANGTTDTTLAATGETGKLPTAATVKTYVDNAITQNNTDTAYSSNTTDMITVNAANHTISAVTGTVATGQTGLVNGGQVADAIATAQQTNANTYQEKSDDSYQVGGANGTWETMAAGTYTTLTRDATTDPDNPTVKYDINAATTAAGVTSGATTIPTSGAVADAIAAATGNQNIPSMPSKCDATHPCVLTNDTTDGHLVWVPIQQ